MVDQMDQKDKKTGSKKSSKKPTSVTSPVVLERRIIPEGELEPSQQNKRFYFNYFDDEIKRRLHKKEHESENTLFKKEKKDKKK